MKKVFLLIVCAVAFMAGQAQVKFGVKSGFNFANIVGDGDDFNDMKLSFYAGAFANFPLANHFSVQPELVFSRQGAKIEDEGDDHKYRLNYLNIPVLGQYNHPSGFYAETGPQFGFLINAKLKEDGRVHTVTDNYKGFDLSWAFGAGFQFTKQASAGIRWNLGLTDIWDHPGTGHNRVLQIGVAYRLN
ncbi:PorT family protein [Pseudoflavitalea sp. X16]|uniref:porin family protein n=1 Tax=Paraflavitalea devenefica TaxID=2716334 RepID=UPI001424808C|nr:porin family protein [Paraflavitalea devenefica]NII28073.1 PorT family protein [Paraflavitalea devenefica]